MYIYIYILFVFLSICFQAYLIYVKRDIYIYICTDIKLRCRATAFLRGGGLWGVWRRAWPTTPFLVRGMRGRISRRLSLSFSSSSSFSRLAIAPMIDRTQQLPLANPKFINN